MKRILSVILSLALLCAMLPAAGAADDFADVPQNAWFAEAVDYAVANGLMNGVGNGRFDPDGGMTRAMLVTVLWRFEKSPEAGTGTFTDVPAGQWFTQAVAWAATNGIVGGVGNGRFDPNGNITREQMAAILFRYSSKKDMDMTKRGDLSGFPDQSKVSEYAKEAIAWAVGEGIIGGSNGQLLPQGNATRAQVSTILMRFIVNVVEPAKLDPTEPTEVPTEATEVPTEATEVPTEATEAPTEATEEPTEATEVPTEATEVPTEATEAPTEATEAPTEATEAPTEATEVPTEATEPIDYSKWKAAIVTDGGAVDDASFNQAVYEAGKGWCEKYGVDFTYYIPAYTDTVTYIETIEAAISDGRNVLLLPGYILAEAIVKTCEKYPDVTFIALDVSEFDLQDAAGHAEDFGWDMPDNVFSAVYQEELAGYMAGYAAVKLGYKKLGFLGGMPVPAVVRYGYGFVQGADQAAKELGIAEEVSLKYAYGNQFWGDADITAYMDNWYASGTEVVFACGGGIYTSAAEAAAKVGGKIIGVDVDQAPSIDADYGAGTTLTSAMKGLGQTVRFALEELINNENWDALGGGVKTLGLISEDPAEAFVCLADSTQWNAGFTEEDYADLVGRLFRGELTVSADIETKPDTAISVKFLGDFRAWHVALITDSGDINDQAYNQTVYEAGEAWCKEYCIDFACYRPSTDSNEALVEAIETAISDGSNVLLLPGFMFAEVVPEVSTKYPNVYFVAIDAVIWKSFGNNVFSADYQLELSGYMAGYAAVKMGYRKLGFLGGMPVGQVVKYGYGFIQGADQAAKELGITDQVSVKHIYGNQYYGDEHITSYMDYWYASGTEAVFSCGGSIYTSVAEAAAKYNGKVIGIDFDQASTIDAWGEGMTLTSAVKGIGQTVGFVLDELINNDNWNAFGGKTGYLGIISDNPAKNFVGLADSTQWNAGFTEEDYADLVGRLFRGELTVSDRTDVPPSVSIIVDYQGTIGGGV